LNEGNGHFIPRRSKSALEQGLKVGSLAEKLGYK
jgi:hypothetical protein